MIITKNLYSISTKPSRVVILGSKGFIASELKTKLKDLDIKFKCECRKNIEASNVINCKNRNWFQKVYDKILLIK